MRKTEQKYTKFFDSLERKTLEDIKSRRKLTEDERTELEELTVKEKSKEELADADIDRLNELRRLNSYLKPGIRYPILSRNKKMKSGKRFVYIGIDNDFHIGRVGKCLKVPMLTE